MSTIQSPVPADYVDEFCAALKAQLAADQERWGDTWLHRPKAGQEERILDRIGEYYGAFKVKGTPVPWLQVAGNALIAWVREQHPDLFPVK